MPKQTYLFFAFLGNADLTMICFIDCGFQFNKYKDDVQQVVFKIAIQKLWVIRKRRKTSLIKDC